MTSSRPASIFFSIKDYFVFNFISGWNRRGRKTDLTCMPMVIFLNVCPCCGVLFVCLVWRWGVLLFSCIFYFFIPDRTASLISVPFKSSVWWAGFPEHV